MNPLTPQYFWNTFHNIDTIDSHLDDNPLSVLFPDQNGNTDTSSLLREEQVDFGVDLSQAISSVFGYLAGSTFDPITNSQQYGFSVTTNKTFYISGHDPPHFIGFDVATGGADDPLFASVTLQFQQDSYDIEALVNGTWLDLGSASPLDPFLFPSGGVSEFRILNIEGGPNLSLIMGLNFGSDGQFNGTVTPLFEQSAQVSEPSTLLLLLAPFLGIAGYEMRRKASGV